MNRSVIIILLAACCIAAALAGCTGSAPEGAGKQGTAAPAITSVAGSLTVTEAQNNATVQVKKGDTLKVELPENPTTGYRWNMSTSAGLKITDDTFIPSDTSGKLVGAGGTRVWTMTVADTGVQWVRALSLRSWEQVTGGEDAFFMKVAVK